MKQYHNKYLIIPTFSQSFKENSCFLKNCKLMKIYWMMKQGKTKYTQK